MDNILLDKIKNDFSKITKGHIINGQLDEYATIVILFYTLSLFFGGNYERKNKI